VTPSLPKRIIIALRSILSIGAEEPQGLTVSCLIGVWTIVGSTPHSALSENFGGNSAIKEQGLSIIAPLWTSATWWHLIAPDAIQLSKFVIDWMWLPMNDRSLFVPGKTPGGRVISPPDWQVMALRVDLSSNQPDFVLSKHDRCIQEGWYACASNTWRRSS
jgi:hypothetical protein